MKGDFSRDSFEPLRSFSRVMMQQGRVQLDADWNEQTSITLDYVRTLARDILGAGAGPEAECGFRIATVADVPPPPANKPDPFTSEQRDAIAANEQALKRGDLLLFPGRYYVGGLGIRLGESMLYGGQSGYPFDDPATVDVLKDSKGSWLAYLDVWEEFVSADEDELILEPALGGVDTCGRAQILWQVRVIPNPAKSVEDELTALVGRGSGLMSARTRPGEAPDSPCIIPPDARYRGVENQLYRVEIHRSSNDQGQGATFKWSRDNGSLTYPIKDFSDDAVTLARLGRDERSGLAKESWVEFSDDCWTGRDPAGALAQVGDVRQEQRLVTLNWATPKPDLPRREDARAGLRPVLRRWDHRGKIEENEGALVVEQGKEIELENGIFIRFKEGGSYRAGDYWLIPARVASNDILWPGGPSDPQPRPHHGPVHYYAPLAKSNKGAFKDLRRKFSPISVDV